MLDVLILMAIFNVIVKEFVHVDAVAELFEFRVLNIESIRCCIFIVLLGMPGTASIHPPLLLWNLVENCFEQ